MDSTPSPKIPLIHILRHGEALHNVEREHPHRDPPLTEAGQNAANNVKLAATPDLILISPMTRTIQTAMILFPFLQDLGPFPIPVQIWPELREANDAFCNKGLPRAELQAKFPQFDFSECRVDWDYPAHTIEGATERAEAVRRRVKELSGSYKDIIIVTHRGLIAYLVKGRRFNLCESRSYRFASAEELQVPKVRMGLNCDTLLEQDFGPTVLVLHRNLEG
ncbi:phosphoglycerate mutase-like protein [Trematosphaeria pertusa]|uniref:Phosphoglycerate mutase-like protein n=1 Tax=Trematosphaeria pertusa TaxID=390896 RepID=A0A6A6IXK8_9PLEO|nr:phosphoglycerate mutase-like protein [Trematosphaeria pertusa]KAF2255285.1 phosphoglycerate mutase-like protein [Trematosphaeria pertusa]